MQIELKVSEAERSAIADLVALEIASTGNTDLTLEVFLARSLQKIINGWAARALTDRRVRMGDAVNEALTRVDADRRAQALEALGLAEQPDGRIAPVEDATEEVRAAVERQ